MFTRIALFMLTNLAVLAVAGVVLNLLGIDRMVLDAAGGYALNYTGLFIFSAVFGFGGAFVSLFLSKWMAKRATRTRIIDKPSNETETWLLETTRQLARSAGISTPEVGIFPAQEPNAFATGANRNKSLVAVSEGLLRNMRRDEVRAVLGHEIGHIANGDMVTLSLLQGIPPWSRSSAATAPDGRCRNPWPRSAFRPRRAPAFGSCSPRILRWRPGYRRSSRSRLSGLGKNQDAGGWRGCRSLFVD